MVTLPSASELTEFEWDTAHASAEGSGEITEFDGSLWFKFEAIAGVTYKMYMSKIGDYSNSATANLFDASGNLIEAVSISQTFQLNAGDGGVFYIQLGDISELPGEASISMTTLSGVDKYTYGDHTGAANERIITDQSNDNIQIGQGIDAITGYGADYINGNTAANRIWGGSGNDIAFGNAGDDVIWGGLGQDRLYGDADNDQIFGGFGADRIYGGVGSDRLFGGAGGDELNGESGVDILRGGKDGDRLDGGTEGDFLYGEEGNDIYIVNDQDTLVELANQGTDTVQTTIAWTLGDNFEKLTLTGTGDISGTGNGLANTITGNDASNRIDGKAGADTMSGLGGNDIYVVDNAADKIVEGVGSGTADAAYVNNVSYALTAGAEIELLATGDGGGTTALNLTGNDFAQSIIGNNGVNRVDGKGGADTMNGRAGNDSYVVDNAGDSIVEIAGGGTADAVYVNKISYVLTAAAQVELLATGDGSGTTALNLTGNDFAQSVIGNDGVNRIDGKGGADTLSGRGGADTFVFSSAPSQGIDRIGDYNVAADTIELKKAIFSAAGNLGGLGQDSFWASAAGTAHDGSDRILYDTDSGAVFYDPDGNKAGGVAAVQFATISVGLGLTHADFVIA